MIDDRSESDHGPLLLDDGFTGSQTLDMILFSSSQTQESILNPLVLTCHGRSGGMSLGIRRWSPSAMQFNLQPSAESCQTCVAVWNGTWSHLSEVEQHNNIILDEVTCLNLLSYIEPSSFHSFTVVHRLFLVNPKAHIFIGQSIPAP